MKFNRIAAEKTRRRPIKKMPDKNMESPDRSLQHELSDVARPGPLTESALLGRKTATAIEVTTTSPPVAYQALVGLFLGYAFLTTGNGLFQTLIPVRLLQEGTPTVVLGLIQAFYYCGFMLGAIIHPRLIARIGQHRTFVALSAAVAILALMFGAAHSAWVLVVLRLISGFAFMGLFTSVESWLNGSTANEMRGRVFGSYATITYLSVGTGQLLLNFGEGLATVQFSIVAGLFAAAVLPVTLLEGWPVKVADEAFKRVPIRTWRESVREMHAATALAIPGCILAGFLYSTFYSMMPVYLARVGFTTKELSIFMGAALFGALLPQWPMGRLSDKIERRTLVFITALISACLSVILLASASRTFLWCGMLAYVTVTFTQYGLIVSHVQDRTESHLRVSISATLLVLFSLGGMMGPLLASSLMSALGPNGLFLFNAISCSLLALSAYRASRYSSRPVNREPNA
jgi:MFS family permease